MAQKRKPLSFWKRIQNFITTTIIGGFLVVLPITLLILLINFLFQFIRRILRPIINLIDIPFVEAEWLIYVIAIAAVLLAFFFIGLFVQTNFGKRLYKYLEDQFLDSIPFYSIISETVQQFFGRDQMPFSQVVSVNVFGNETRMIGFISEDLGDDRYSVFVPTGPNPTNGFIFMVHNSQLEYLSVKPEDAMRIIIGVGTGAKEFFNGVEKEEEERKDL